MSLYQRGKVWWYEFEFRGQRIRESTHSRTKSIAERIERERRRQLELGSVGLKEHRAPQMFSVASKKWLEAARRTGAPATTVSNPSTSGTWRRTSAASCWWIFPETTSADTRQCGKKREPARAPSTWKWEHSGPSCASTASGPTFSRTCAC